jgi:hypothetical protein
MCEFDTWWAEQNLDDLPIAPTQALKAIAAKAWKAAHEAGCIEGHQDGWNDAWDSVDGI